MADGKRAQMPEWNSSVHTRSGVACHPTVVNVPPGTECQPPCDLRQDEVDETQRHWIQELGCQQKKNEQQRGKGNEPEKESSDSYTQSSAPSQGHRSSARAMTSDDNERQQRAQDYKRALEGQMHEKQQRLRTKREAEDRKDRKQERYMDEERQKVELECERERLEQSGRRHFSSESQEGNPWGGPGGGAPSCQPADSSPLHTDAQGN